MVTWVVMLLHGTNVNTSRDVMRWCGDDVCVRVCLFAVLTSSLVHVTLGPVGDGVCAGSDSCVATEG